MLGILSESMQSPKNLVWQIWQFTPGERENNKSQGRETEWAPGMRPWRDEVQLILARWQAGNLSPLAKDQGNFLNGLKETCRGIVGFVSPQGSYNLPSCKKYPPKKEALSTSFPNTFRLVRFQVDGLSPSICFEKALRPRLAHADVPQPGRHGF